MWPSGSRPSELPTESTQPLWFRRRWGRGTALSGFDWKNRPKNSVVRHASDLYQICRNCCWLLIKIRLLANRGSRLYSDWPHRHILEASRPVKCHWRATALPMRTTYKPGTPTKRSPLTRSSAPFLRCEIYWINSFVWLLFVNEECVSFYVGICFCWCGIRSLRGLIWHPLNKLIRNAPIRATTEDTGLSDVKNSDGWTTSKEYSSSRSWSLLLVIENEPLIFIKVQPITEKWMTGILGW